MSLSKKIIFSLIPAVVLFASLEGVCLLWERSSKNPAAMPRAAGALPTKEEGEFRVLFYGGSTVVGEPEVVFGFVAQLEYYLKKIAPDRTIRFFNFAASGEPSAYVVRKMDQTVRGSNADAIVVLTAHNEFIFIKDMTSEELNSLYAIQENMYRSALVRRLRRMVYRYHTARREEILKGENLTRFDRTSVRFRERVELYRENLGTIVRLAKLSGAPLFLCTGPWNQSSWAPVYMEYSEYSGAAAYKEAINEGKKLIKEQKPAEALSLMEESNRRFPNDAIITFLAAESQLALGATERALELFTLAKDIDPIPFRVLSIFNEMVRSKEDRPDVRAVDLERIFIRSSPGGAVGFESIADNCHPTPQGSHLIATSLIEAFREAGLIEYAGNAKDQFSLDEFLKASLDPAELKQARMRYFLANARTCLKPPYYNPWASQLYIDRALEVDPENWEAWANQATIFYLQGRKEEGGESLRKAIALKGSALNLSDQEKTPLLKETLEGHGIEIGE